jgi:hypothetical protein
VDQCCKHSLFDREPAKNLAIWSPPSSRQGRLSRRTTGNCLLRGNLRLRPVELGSVDPIRCTGRPNRLSSVHSHEAVGPVSRRIRPALGAFDLTNAAIASGPESTTPPARSIPSGSQRKSMSASDTRQSDMVFHRSSASLREATWGQAHMSARADSLCYAFSPASRSHRLLQHCSRLMHRNKQCSNS